MNLDTLIYQQNPQWLDLTYQKPEKTWFHRIYIDQITRWLDKRPITALTGIRRSGKSTILKQIKYLLEDKEDKNRILYFSFEKSQTRFHPDVLRDILDWYIGQFLKKSISTLSETLYIFLDEIQYIPYWQDVLKTYYDQSPYLKFFISGSSSLFIKKSLSESLAGRMIEIFIPVLHFREYRKIKNITWRKDISSIFPQQKQVITGFFEDYLKYGQFPETIKDNYEKEQVKAYLSGIEEKIIEQDLPKLYRIERIDILRLIFTYLKTHTGGVVEYQNLTNDLGIDLKTTRKYFDYLKKSYLVSDCYNQTKKPVRSARTAKKVYLGSTNFSQAEISLDVENYVYNYLSREHPVKFYRKGNFEVDFIIDCNEKQMPAEVKYQEKIDPRDTKNLVTLSRKLNSRSALLITKNLQQIKQIKGVKIEFVPACLLEETVSQTQ